MVSLRRGKLGQSVALSTFFLMCEVLQIVVARPLFAGVFLTEPGVEAVALTHVEGYGPVGEQDQLVNNLNPTSANASASSSLTFPGFPSSGDVNCGSASASGSASVTGGNGAALSITLNSNANQVNTGCFIGSTTESHADALSTRSIDLSSGGALSDGSLTLSPSASGPLKLSLNFNWMASGTIGSNLTLVIGGTYTGTDGSIAESTAPITLDQTGKVVGFVLPGTFTAGGFAGTSPLPDQLTVTLPEFSSPIASLDVSVTAEVGQGATFIAGVPMPSESGSAFFSADSTCNDILASLGSEIKINPADPSKSGQPTSMEASFTPIDGLTLTQAANDCGFKAFDWQQQIVTRPSGVAVFANGSDTPLTPPFLDPPPGGYTYQTPPSTAYPFYYDPRSGATGPFALTSNETFGASGCFPPPPMTDGSSSTTLCFFDAPQIPTFAGDHQQFTTDLVGVLPDNSPGADLYHWDWKDSYHAALTDFAGGTGGIDLLNTDALVDGEGTGGITLLDVNGFAPEEPSSVPEPNPITILISGCIGFLFLRTRRVQ